jgi:hypothetical protein
MNALLSQCHDGARLKRSPRATAAGDAAIAWTRNSPKNPPSLLLCECHLETSIPQVFTITTPPAQQEVEAADRLVRQLSPGARKTYALGGTQKYELPTSEVSLSQVR